MRASLVAYACSGRIGSDWEHWDNYKPNQGLDRWRLGRRTHVEYRRKKKTSPTLKFLNIQPKGIRDAVETEPVELDSKIIDAASITVDNSTGSQPSGPWDIHGRIRAHPQPQRVV